MDEGDPNLESILVPIVAALIAALGSYLAAVKGLSGRITTSSASELWDAAEEIRKEYRDENAHLRRRVKKLEAESDACKRKVAELTNLVQEQQQTIERLESA